jgi:hypothetical protein
LRLPLLPGSRLTTHASRSTERRRAVPPTPPTTTRLKSFRTALIWQDADGTHIGYLDPRELADRYALDGCQEALERQAAVLATVAAAAAG